MGLIVQKFGGSSVADAERIKRVAKRVAETYDAGNNVIVVVSAMGDTTDDLIELAAQLTDKPAKREMDMLLSTGEQQSIALLTMALCSIGYKAVSLNGSQAGFVTDGVYGKAKIEHINSERLEDELGKGNICVVAGFQGIDAVGDINTLGRGGSDTSAAALAIALSADVCEIFTDVNGVYTADPRIVPKAHKLPVISYDEMLEMAAMGAGVLHPRSVELAKQFGLKLHVRSSFNHEEGTIVQETKISGDTNMNNKHIELEKDVVVAGVANDTDVIKITIFGVPDKPGVAADIFTSLAAERVNVDMIVQSGTKNNCQDISFTTSKGDRDRVESVMTQTVTELEAEGYRVEDAVAKISIVGAGMISHPGVAAKMFKVLSDNQCNINIISTSEIKISCIIDSANTQKAVQALHTAFDLDIK